MPFLNGEAARAAGFRACRQCRPDDPTTAVAGGDPPLAIRYECGTGPVGDFLVASTARGICALYLLNGDEPSDALDRLRRDFPRATIEANAETPGSAVSRVVAHLNADRRSEELALDLRGTPFQVRVWEALRAIPRGTTTTYGALAQSLGLPIGAARAVGTACGANPVSLIVPCHRVVGAGGKLVGYYWGIERKRALLNWEGVSI